MALVNKKCLKFCFLLVVVVLISHTECRRSSGGSRPSGSRPSSSRPSSSRPSSSPSHSSGFGSSHPSPSSHGFGSSHPSSSSSGFGSSRPSPSSHGFGSSHPSPGGYGFGNSPSSPSSHGFGSSHPSPSGSFGGFRPSTGGNFGGLSPSSGFHPSVGNTGGYGPHGSISNTHTVTGGVGIRPSVPVGPPNSRPGIGFDNVNHPSTSTGGIHTQTNIHQLNSGRPSSPSAPVGPPAPKPGLGFDNVNHHTQTNTHQLNSGKPISPSAPLGPPQNRPGIGFDNVNHQSNQHINSNAHQPLGTGAHRPNYPVQPGTHYGGNTATYHPYQPQTVIHSGGTVQYRPPLQQQYVPPVTTVHHVVPVYQPVAIYKSYPTYHSGSSGSALGYGGSFLGGYLIGRMSSNSYGYGSHYHHHHYDNNYNYNNDRRYDSDNNYNRRNEEFYYRNDKPDSPTVVYTVHHHYQNPEKVSNKFSISGANTVECKNGTSDTLCSPNTHSICLRNGTIMCVTHMPFVVSCDQKTGLACVYSRIDCNMKPPCEANQTFIDFYLPCIANVTLINDNIIVDSSIQNIKKDNVYELCVTAIAEPKTTLESPVGAFASFFTQLGAYHIKNIMDVQKGEKGTNGS